MTATFNHVSYLWDDTKAAAMAGAFNIEYRLLEEASIQRLPKPKPLIGRIALIKGSGGGIGKAIAKRFAQKGACVILNDNNEERLKEAKADFLKRFGKYTVAANVLDVTKSDTIVDTVKAAILAFGGMDIIVNKEGLSISKPIEGHKEQDWDILYYVLVKGQFAVTQTGVEVMRKQGFGGDVLKIVSKNALVSGPNNAGYGSAKAAQFQLSSLNAAELGKDKIRVSVVNPDAMISGSNIWAIGWAEGGVKAYGITAENLPA